MDCRAALEKNCDIYPLDIAVRIIYPQADNTSAIEEISWLELNKYCNKIANLLLSRHIKPKDTVNVAGLKWKDRIPIILAILKIGARVDDESSVPIDNAKAVFKYDEFTQEIKIVFAVEDYADELSLEKCLRFMSGQNPNLTLTAIGTREENVLFSDKAIEDFSVADVVVISEENTVADNLQKSLTAVCGKYTMIVWNA